MGRRRSALVRAVLAAVAIVAIVGMHGSGAEAHSCVDAHEGPRHDAGEHEHHEPGGSGESPAHHCGVMACITTVTAAADGVPGLASETAAHHRSPIEPLRWASAAPEPPVPRLFPHA